MYTTRQFAADLKKARQLTAPIAKQILADGSVRGHKLSKRQEGFFGRIANGG